MKLQMAGKLKSTLAQLLIIFGDFDQLISERLYQSVMRFKILLIFNIYLFDYAF